MRASATLSLTAKTFGILIPPSTRFVDHLGREWSLVDQRGEGPPGSENPVRFQVKRTGVDTPGWIIAALYQDSDGDIFMLTALQGVWLKWVDDNTLPEVDDPTGGAIIVPPPPPPPENRVPTWNMTDIIFEQGVPAEIDLRTRASDLDGDPLAFNVETGLRADLVGPFTFNDFKLFYDGSDMGLAEDAPPLVLDTGITISADDNRADGPNGG